MNRSSIDIDELNRIRNRDRIWYKNNAVKIRERKRLAIALIKSKRSPEINYLIAREHDLKWHFGISLEEYNRQFQIQGGRCKICLSHQSEQKRSLAVDHCHLTDKNRGLLCGRCNRGIGCFKDNPELLKLAIEYLVKAKWE